MAFGVSFQSIYFLFMCRSLILNSASIVSGLRYYFLRVIGIHKYLRGTAHGAEICSLRLPSHGKCQRSINARNLDSPYCSHPRTTGWGKSRFTVVSMGNTEVIIVLLFINIVFSI